MRTETSLPALPALPGLLSPLAPSSIILSSCGTSVLASLWEAAAAARKCLKPSCPPSPLSLLRGTGPGSPAPAGPLRQRAERPGWSIPVSAVPGAPTAAEPPHGYRGHQSAGPRGAAASTMGKRPSPRVGAAGAASHQGGRGSCLCSSLRAVPWSQGLSRQPRLSPGQWGFELLMSGLIRKRLNEIGEVPSTVLKASYGVEERVVWSV